MIYAIERFCYVLKLGISAIEGYQEFQIIISMKKKNNLYFFPSISFNVDSSFNI